MKININPQKAAIGIVFLAFLVFIIGSGYAIYKTNQKTYVAGSPPKELTQKIPPKSVPYSQIKPPAVNTDDGFIIGSTSSTYGIVFYGDYTNPESNKLFNELIGVLAPYGDLIRLNYRHLPASIEDGDMSFETAVISECSRILEQGWPMHYLFTQSNADKISRAYIRAMIENVSLEPEMLNACQYNTQIRDNVAESIAIAKGDGIDKAPFVFVGTQSMPSQEVTTQKIIDALKKLINN